MFCMNKFSENLKRLKGNTTGQDLAKELGVSAQQISFYIKGREPSYTTLIRIADYFNVSIDFLLGHTTSEIPNSQDRLKAAELEIDSLKQENELLKDKLQKISSISKI